MTLLKLDISSVRNIHKATLVPSPSLNFIIGANASGKSSLLEAIFILARARSFRTSNIKQAIEFNQSALTIFAKNQYYSGQVSDLGIQIDSKNSEIHIDREVRSKSDLAYSLPLQIIHPKSYKLLDSGPQIRREFLDWGVFNDEYNYLNDWRTYKNILQQRNSLLKIKQLRQLDVWNQQLVQYGEIIAEKRLAYLQRLEPVCMDICQEFLGDVHLKLNFMPGWSHADDFLTILKNDFDKDIRHGYTHSGPHRSDFQLLINHRMAKDYVSRGQLKLLVLSLKLAQVKLLNSRSNHSLCFLVDDLTAELDTVNRSKLVKYLSESNCQVFMSAIDFTDFGVSNSISNFKVFHVAQGRVSLQTCFT